MKEELTIFVLEGFEHDILILCHLLDSRYFQLIVQLFIKKVSYEIKSFLMIAS